MNKTKCGWLLVSALLLLLTSAVIADDTTATQVPAATATSEEQAVSPACNQETQETPATTAAAAATPDSWTALGGGIGTQPPSRCVCRCTCPASGAFQYQCHSQPAGGCGQLNGRRCSVGPFSTCNTTEVLQGCVPEELSQVACP